MSVLNGNNEPYFEEKSKIISNTLDYCFSYSEPPLDFYNFYIEKEMEVSSKYFF